MLSLIVSLCLVLQVTQGADLPFDQDLSFRGLFQTSTSALNIPSWEGLPFSTSSVKYRWLHVNNKEKDCFLSLADDHVIYGSSKAEKTDKLQLSSPFQAWQTLQYQNIQAQYILPSYTDKYDFLMVTDRNILGVQLVQGKTCSAVGSAVSVLAEDFSSSWGKIQAITSSSSHIWITTTSSSNTVIQINLKTGLVEGNLQLSSTSSVSPSTVSALYYVSTWNKLFVSTNIAFYTIAYTTTDISMQYEVSHEWITGVLDSPPIALDFDKTSNCLWMAESQALHKLDTQGRIWRYGYHQGSPFANLTSVTVANDYVYIGSASGGLARMKVVQSPAQADTLSNNRGIVLMKGEEEISSAAASSVGLIDPWQWSYYHGHRYLPDNQVQALVVSADKHGSVVLAITSTGTSLIQTAKWTLAEKAKAYEQFQEPRHDRYNLTTNCGLSNYGDLNSFYKHVDDNDGLWTSMHGMGEAYNYAITGDEKARQLAWRAFEGVEMLSKVTGVYPKYVARTYCYYKDVSETGCGGSGDADPEWNVSSLYSDMKFKSDTSSDETTGHFAIYPLIYDLVAKTSEEKQRVYHLWDGLTRSIVENDLYLIDPLTQKPTKWGFWNPKEVNDDVEHYSERAMNSLEILSYLASAYSLTRDPLYKSTFDKLVNQHGYVRNMMNVKIDNPLDDNHSDNELMMLSFHTFFYAWYRIDGQKEPDFKVRSN